jgi:predicted O-methyltransferase YrrM
MSVLASAVKRVAPVTLLAPLAAARDGLLALRGDLIRARAKAIPFYSGLGDSADLLYGLVRSMKPQVCVEIGSARGRSTCFIAIALKENGDGILHAIDPHAVTTWNDDATIDTFKIIKRNVSRLGLDKQVNVIRGTSEQAAANWKEPIDLLFIDGDHSYAGVKKDWEIFKEFVKPFGLVVFHDTIWDLRPNPKWHRPDMGVPRFVDELRAQGYQVVTIDQDFGVSLVQPTIGGQALRPAA